MGMRKPSTPHGISIRNRQEIKVPIETSSKMLSISSVGTTIRVVEKIGSKKMMRIIFISLITRDMEAFRRGLFEIRNGSKKPQEKLQSGAQGIDHN